MKLLAATLIALAFAVPASAVKGKTTLRVDRPEMRPGARITTVQLIAGTVRHRMSARVLTDTRCTPDMMGVSHCLNRLQLGNGAVITVVHNHRMATMPCLDPGEHVVLTPQ